VNAGQLAIWLDTELESGSIPDYPQALNGLQVDNRGQVRKIGAAVDCSVRTIRMAAAAGVNFLTVHHGLFWEGTQPIRGNVYERLRLLMSEDIAVYSSHLPLDRHPTLGNNALLARKLGLEPNGEFASYKGRSIGVRGIADTDTQSLIARAREFGASLSSHVRTTTVDPGRRTRHWGLCTGSGASSETVAEAYALGIDTLLVGEGPHHTAVAADELGICVIYIGHYATETLGVQEIASRAAAHLGIPWEFLHAPSGL
jgi:dinuclear metal center YbgI/SA1388 family protein